MNPPSRHASTLFLTAFAALLLASAAGRPAFASPAGHGQQPPRGDVVEALTTLEEELGEAACTPEAFEHLAADAALFAERLGDCTSRLARRAVPRAEAPCAAADAAGRGVSAGEKGLCICAATGTMLLGGGMCASPKVHAALLRYRRAVEAVTNVSDLAALDRPARVVEATLAATRNEVERAAAFGEFQVMTRRVNAARHGVRELVGELCPRMADERDVTDAGAAADCAFRMEHNRVVYELGLATPLDFESSGLHSVGLELNGRVSHPLFCEDAFCLFFFEAGLGWADNRQRVGAMSTARASLGATLLLSRYVQLGGMLDTVLSIQPLRSLGTNNPTYTNLAFGPKLFTSLCPGGGDFCLEFGAFVRTGSSSSGEVDEKTHSTTIKTEGGVMSYGLDLGFAVHL